MSFFPHTLPLFYLGYQRWTSKRGQRQQEGVPAVVYTFDPPPRVALCGAPQLSSVAEKVERLHRCGADLVVVASFDQTYRECHPLEFIEKLKRLSPLVVQVGLDFRFGHQRAGDVALLRQHLCVQTIAPVRCPGEK